MFKKIKKWFVGWMLKKTFGTKSTTKEYALIGGHRFVVLDPITMPKIRQAAIFIGEYERDWGMTKNDLLAYDDVMVKETEFPTDWAGKDDLIAQLTDKLKRLYQLADTRRLLIQEDFQYKPFLKAACHMILMDDEPADKIDNTYMQQKLALCQSNEDVQLFFLRVIRAFVQNTLPSFDITKMWEYYPPQHLLPTEKRVLKEIQQTIYSDGD